MRSSRYALLLLLVLLVPGACSTETDGTIDTTPPNVILISIDALGAAHLGSYGNPRPVTPFLDRMASEGTRFEYAFANTHGTTPSHTTLLSGTYQETHRVSYEEVTDSAGEVVYPIPEELPLLQEIFRAAGYHTIGITDGGNIGGKFGFGRGFDVFSDQGGGVEAVCDRLVAQLDEAGPGPLFLFLHTYEVHSPYEPPDDVVLELADERPDVDATSSRLLQFAHSTWALPPGELDSLRLLYDAGLRYTDRELAALFTQLEQRGLLDNAVVIITSDHGEELGEHGGLLHRDLLYEELVHVPLIAWGRGVPEGVVREELVSLVDVAPTLLNLAGVPVPEAMEGDVILPVTSDRDLVFAQYGPSRYMVRSSRWKLIESPIEEKLELYDLESDPGETANLASSELEVVDRYRRELRRWLQQRSPMETATDPVALDDEELQRLKALGYLGGD